MKYEPDIRKYSRSREQMRAEARVDGGSGGERHREAEQQRREPRQDGAFRAEQIERKRNRTAEKKDGEKVDMTTDDAQITNSTSVMLTTVAGDDYAIGYVSLGSLNDTVKALKIDGEEATEQNIKDGKYKICRPFNIATKKGADNELAKDFISYIMSKEGQQVISDNGYIGDDSAEAYAGTKPSGKVVVGGSSSVSPVMEKLIEAYKKVNTGAEIELQTTDSTTGLTSSIDGSYDIGMASRELQDDEKDKLDSQAIATDGIAVIVNKNNTTDELSSDQVKDIYTGEITDWSELQ